MKPEGCSLVTQSLNSFAITYLEDLGKTLHVQLKILYSATNEHTKVSTLIRGS